MASTFSQQGQRSSGAIPKSLLCKHSEAQAVHHDLYVWHVTCKCSNIIEVYGLRIGIRNYIIIMLKWPLQVHCTTP